MTANIACAHTEVWPLERFKPHPQNPNKHPEEQLQLLAKVIVGAGWRSPIVVSRLSGLVIKGHGRLAAAKIAGLTQAPVDLQDYASTEMELADMVADNRLAELAEIDLSAVKDILGDLDDGAFNMDLTGFSNDALGDLMSQFHPETDADAEPQIDKAAELQARWDVAPGQLWELGEHRLLCGDSAKRADVDVVMGGGGG